MTTQPGRDSRVHRASAALMHAALVGAGVVGTSWADLGSGVVVETIATIAATLLTASAITAGVAFLTSRWRIEMIALPIVGIALIGFMLASPIVNPWYPGGTLVALLAMALLFSLSVRLTDLIARSKLYVRLREGAQSCPHGAVDD